MIQKGKYVARGTGRFELCTSKKGTQTVAVEVEIVEGENTGRVMVWWGYFTDATEERTIESLRYLGWQGDDVTTLEGLGSRRVEIVVDHEPDLQGKVWPKIQWVNRLGGGGLVKVNNPMSAEAKRIFAAHVKGLARAKPALPPETTLPARLPADGAMADESPPHTDDDLPF